MTARKQRRFRLGFWGWGVKQACSFRGLLASGSDDDEEHLSNARLLLDAAGIRPEPPAWGGLGKVADASTPPPSEKRRKGEGDNTEKTPFTEFLQRRKQKRRDRKSKLRERAQTVKTAPAEQQSSEAPRKPHKKLKLLQQAEKLPANTSDPRFEALFVNSDFAIDKTHSQFKGGAMADKQVQEKRERRALL